MDLTRNSGFDQRTMDLISEYGLEQQFDESTIEMLNDYDHQAMIKRRTNQTPGSSNAIKNERAILRELPIEMLTSTNDDDNVEEEECGLKDEFDSFYDDKHFKKNECSTRTTPSRKGWQNIRPNEVKSSWRGEFFPASIERNAVQTVTNVISKADLRVLSSIEDKCFQYGFENLSDFFELIPEDVYEDDEELVQNQVTLSGTIFSIDDRVLSFDNVYLFTRSKAFSLDLEHVDKLAFFPGKKVTLVGNLVNEILHVQEIVDPRFLKLPPLMLNNQQNTQKQGRLKILVAFGPFSSNANAEPDDVFDSLMAQTVEDNVNALILIGPFVPKTSQVGQSFDAIFQSYIEKISFLLQRNLNTSLRIIIIPNAQIDLCSQPFFPTPPYQKPFNKIVHKDITFLPDPAVFELDGVRIAATSSEVIAHLSKLELYKSIDVENEDRMCRLISHLFNSHSLYPLYPSDTNLSCNLTCESHANLKLTEIPHVLIVPSYLQPMVKIVDGCIVINPGRFTRGKSAGTYAQICINMESAEINSCSSNLNFSVAPHSEVCLISAKWNSTKTTINCV